MIVKWANDALLQANNGKMLVNDGEMMSSLARISPSFASHLTIIEKLHQLYNRSLQICHAVINILAIIQFHKKWRQDKNIIYFNNIFFYLLQENEDKVISISSRK